MKTPFKSEDAKKNNIQVQCPHCNKMGNKPTMKRWHFDNCKLKGVLPPEPITPRVVTKFKWSESPPVDEVFELELLQAYNSKGPIAISVNQFRQLREQMPLASILEQYHTDDELEAL